MRDNTAKWLRKAEADYRSMQLEFSGTAGVGAEPNYDAVCFFAQQCIEKWLKAILVEANIPFPKTHDLQRILILLLPAYPHFAAMVSDLAKLTALSSDVRYPYEFATAMQAHESMVIRTRVRDILKGVLPEPPLFSNA